jgi:transposase-like protein
MLKLQKTKFKHLNIFRTIKIMIGSSIVQKYKCKDCYKYLNVIIATEMCSIFPVIQVNI